MPRGVRKTPLEKLQMELAEIQESMQQYKNSLVTLEEKERVVQDKINLEQFKQVSSMLDEHDMSLSDLKDLILTTSDTE